MEELFKNWEYCLAHSIKYKNTRISILIESNNISSHLKRHVSKKSNKTIEQIKQFIQFRYFNKLIFEEVVNPTEDSL
jgi:hypothetical protein